MTFQELKAAYLHLDYEDFTNKILINLQDGLKTLRSANCRLVKTTRIICSYLIVSVLLLRQTTDYMEKLHKATHVYAIDR